MFKAYQTLHIHFYEIFDVQNQDHIQQIPK